MNKSLPNQCPECSGALEQKTITHDVRFEEKLYSFQNVPARVCNTCGASYLDAPVLKQIENTFKRRREPEQYLKVPAFSFDRLSA